jgi:hypothetical protein
VRKIAEVLEAPVSELLRDSKDEEVNNKTLADAEDLISSPLQ